MRILSLETGSLIAIVGAVEKTKGAATLFASRTLDEPRGLARDLIGAIDSVLSKAGWKLEELDGIAVTTGPGSWTSLRVGLTTAKTLAQSMNIPLAGIPLFDVLSDSAHARERWDGGVLLIVTTCRPGEVYGQVFVHGEIVTEAVFPVSIAPLAKHLEMARQFGLPVFAAGDATEGLPEDVKTLELVPEAVACTLGAFGAHKILRGQADDPLTLVPLYLAPSNAERNLKTS